MVGKIEKTEKMSVIHRDPSEIPHPPEEIVKKIMTKCGRKADVATGTTIAETKKSLDVTEISMRMMIPVVGKMTVDAKKGWLLGEQNVSVHATNPVRIKLWNRCLIDAGLPEMIVTDDTNAQQLVSGSLDISGMKARRKRIVRIGKERKRKSPLGWTPISQLILRLVFLVDKCPANSMASKRGKRE